jgi:IS5 family transposase
MNQVEALRERITRDRRSRRTANYIDLRKLADKTNPASIQRFHAGEISPQMELSEAKSPGDEYLLG